MAIRFLYFYILILGMGCSPNIKESASTIPPARGIENVTLSGIERSILELINEHRQDFGFIPLVAEPNFQELAEQHNLDMYDGKIPFGHDGFSERLKNIQEKMTVNLVAENVYVNAFDAETIIKGWLKSEIHRENILGDFNICGVSYHEGYTTFIFGALIQ